MYEFLKDIATLGLLLFVLLVVPQLQGCTTTCYEFGKEVGCSIPNIEWISYHR